MMQKIKKFQNEKIAEFALRAKFEDVGAQNIEQLKKHLLDSLGSLLFATQKPTILKLVRQLAFLGNGGPCKVPLLDGLAYDRAAQLYTALIRYPDFMDNFMGKEATCHPSDNLGCLLAAIQYRKTNGRDFLTAMAVAYQIECRLVEEIPVMKEGIDHTLLLGYSVTAALARLVGLTEDQTVNALGISGCSISPMVTSRAAYTTEWKGLASSLDALDCMNIIFLAQQNLTGPVALFEGPKGFDDIFGMKLDYDWEKENFELVRKCVLKKFNAEVHSQASLEAITTLRSKHDLKAEDIQKIDITTFLTAYHIIGGGAYGDRKIVESKEQADHSLFYLAAVAVIDGEIYPGQLDPQRIMQADVQELLQKVFVQTGFPLHQPLVVSGILDPYTEAYPDKMKTKVEIHLNDGSTLTQEQDDYHGFFTRPLSWEDTIKKFKRLSAPAIGEDVQQQIIEMVKSLEQLEDMEELTLLLASVSSL